MKKDEMKFCAMVQQSHDAELVMDIHHSTLLLSLFFAVFVLHNRSEDIQFWGVKKLRHGTLRRARIHGSHSLGDLGVSRLIELYVIHRLCNILAQKTK